MNIIDFRFFPYVGSRYGREDAFFKKRLLILGASHYCDGCLATTQGENTRWGELLSCNGCDGKFTKKVLHDYLYDSLYDSNGKRKGWKNTYSKFINTIIGHRSSCQEKDLFCNSVIFYNFLQEIEGIGDNDKHPEKFCDKQRQQRDLFLFKKLLVEYKPEVVIVWGSHVWDNFPDNLGYGCHTKMMTESVLPPYMQNRIWNYCFHEQNITFCASVHPSAYGHFKQNEHKQLFDLLNLY